MMENILVIENRGEEDMCESVKKPGYVGMAYRYTRALSRWIKAGRPIRSEKEIDEIYETQCKNCRAFDHETNSCKYCGCKLGTGTNPLVNKIAMATERCPADKW